MAFLDAIRQDGPHVGYYLECSFASGATVGWGNRAVAIAGLGLVDPRVLSIAPIAHGIAPTWGAAMEVPTISVELDNADGALATYMIGASPSASASAEYLSDSLLNLRATLFAWAIDSAGAVQMQQLSPAMVASQSPEAANGRIRLTLQSRASDTLGRSKFGRITLRMILDSTAGAHGAGYGSIATYLRHNNADSSAWSEQGAWRSFTISQADASSDFAARRIATEGEVDPPVGTTVHVAPLSPE